MSGYISDVSPIKTSKDQKRKFFNFTMTDDVTSHRGVCFSPEKHKLFSNIAQEQSNNGLEIKRFKIALQNEDIIITDFTSAKKTELTFEKNIIAETSTIHQVINECSLYDIVNVSVLVYNLQEEFSVKKEYKSLRVKKAMLKDHTEKISGVFFEEIIDQIKEGACYDLSKMRVQKYQEERVLKSTENSEAVENGVLDLIKNDDDDE